MTKKDFVLVARILREARDEGYSMDQTIKCFASALADANNRFDYAKFVKACEGVR
jgi:chemotaxis regulatin CheY-phosphate phosphatase CheZ